MRELDDTREGRLNRGPSRQSQIAEPRGRLRVPAGVDGGQQQAGINGGVGAIGDRPGRFRASAVSSSPYGPYVLRKNGRSPMNIHIICQRACFSREFCSIQVRGSKPSSRIVIASAAVLLKFAEVGAAQA